jgi:hypothetical protein
MKLVRFGNQGHELPGVVDHQEGDTREGFFVSLTN